MLGRIKMPFPMSKLRRPAFSGRLIRMGRLTVPVVMLTLVVAPLTRAADWPMYLGDVTHNGFAAGESVINAQTAPSLAVKWSVPTSSTISVQPTVAGGRVYWGTWDGHERATTRSGAPVWTASLGTTNGGCGGTYGILSSATVATIGRGETVFVGGGDGQFYALDAATGTVVWKTRLGPSPASTVWSSPVFYNGSIYIGASSTDDCPLIQGKLYRLDAASGAVQNTFKIVPDGCEGGSLWGTPTVDPSTGNVYFATGNDGACSTSEPYATAVVAVHLSDLTLVGSWKIPASQMVDDGDFGSAPTLFQATIGGISKQMLGIAAKNGLYYAFDRNAVSAGPVWQRQIAVGGPGPLNGEGSISPSAWDGNTLYVAGGKTTVGGTSCGGGLRALDPSTGAPLWQDCLNGVILGPVTAAPGIVTVAAGSTILVVSAATGANLFSYAEPSAKPFYGGGSISDGVLYYGNSDGTLLALAPPSNTPSAKTFTVAAGADDGDVSVNNMGAGTAYPPTGAPAPSSNRSSFGVRRAGPVAGGYEVRTGLLRFNTSSIPAGATITSASLRLYVLSRASVNGRTLVAEWDNGAAWPIDASDYAATASTSASTGVAIGSLTVNAVNTLSLQNLGSISRSGYTTLRLHVDGGQPTGENGAFFAAFENGTVPAAQLVVNYTLASTFAVAASADDGDVGVNNMGAGSAYPPTGAAVPAASGASFGVRRAGPVAGGYEVRTGLLRFNTSSIPAGATITSASLRLYVLSRASVN